MQHSKLAIAGMVCMLSLSVETPATAQSRARQDSGYVRGGRATRVAVPRSQAGGPARVRSGQVVRASGQRGVRTGPGRSGRYYGAPVYRSRGYGSRAYYGSRGYYGYRGYRGYYGYRPYGYRYGYRPGFSVGVYLGAPYGFYGAGYGYAGPYAHPYPYAYPAPVYGYPVGAPYGGVRLEVLPRHAEVFVDGYYAGTVDDFDGTFQRLELEEGAHNIEIRAPGFQPATFDVNVLVGQTIKYRADLIPLP